LNVRTQKNNNMAKLKLLEIRKVKGLSQLAVAEKLNMDVSNYNRREK